MSSPKASEGEQPVLLESSHALGYVNKIKVRTHFALSHAQSSD